MEEGNQVRIKTCFSDANSLIVFYSLVDEYVRTVKLLEDALYNNIKT